MDTTAIPATAIDIYRSLPEGVRCEVLYNQLIMAPASGTDHQSLSMRLSGLLFNFFEKTNKGLAFAAPTDLYLENYQSVVQPDLMIIMNENSSIVHKDGVYGAPDIVIEILSGSGVNDTFKKKSLYESAGIKEYFIIDPSDKNVMLFTYDENHRYVLAYEINGKLTSEILGYSFDL